MKKLFLILAATAASMTFANKAQAQTSCDLPAGIVFAAMNYYASPGETMTNVQMYEFNRTSYSTYEGIYSPGYCKSVMEASMPWWATITDWQFDGGYVDQGYELTYWRFTINIDPNAPVGAIRTWYHYSSPWGSYPGLWNNPGQTWIGVR